MTTPTVMKNTLQLKKSGNALIVAVTKEAKTLGLQAGDYIDITVEKARDD